jgi:CheY-like chemotaxis protein
MGNYDVIEAIDAEKGMQLARKNHPDLILMDIQLPGMDGLSATKILKADPVLQEIPIVALTSHAMEGDDKKALAAGCDGYIPKPIDTKNFLPTIGQFIQG